MPAGTSDAENATTDTPAAAPAAHHFDLDQIDWSGGKGRNTPTEMVQQAKRLGARRKRVVTGQGGFFMNYSSLPADYHIARHRHGHPELIMVINGGATVHEAGPDGGDVVLEVGDSIVIEAEFHYAITCGPEGMDFVTIRTSDSDTVLA